MKSRSEVWLQVLAEAGTASSVTTRRDAETLASRVRSEGDSFLKSTLPLYGKEFERTLATEGIHSTAYIGWQRQRKLIPSTGISAVGPPKFLGGFQDLIFAVCGGGDECDGEFHPRHVLPVTTLADFKPEWDFREASIAIASIRQLTLMFAKEKELCSLPLQNLAIRSFLETDRNLDQPLLDDEMSTILFSGGRLKRIKKVITHIFGSALTVVDRQIHDMELIPGHGPGKTADRLNGNQKWAFAEWTDRLEQIFPFSEYALVNQRHNSETLPVNFLEPTLERCVKISLVPKTHATPRIIAIEPTAMQYVQQAISRSFVTELEKDNLAALFVGFTDQGPNNALARIGSTDGSLATLDLSEASDRVANWLVEELFSDWPWFLEGIQACRSTHARLPSGDLVPLQKFASMGSAMTFPIEAVIFAAVTIERILASVDHLSAYSIRVLAGTVRVYGDDIIIPNDSAERVIDGLELCGFKVNRHKSFWTGGFRESCGKEYWYGTDVSIVRSRKQWPSSLRDAEEVISAVSMRNQLYLAGWTQTAENLDVDLMRLFKGRYPIVSENSSILGRVSRILPHTVDQRCKDLQIPLVRGYAPFARSPINGADGGVALLKCLVSITGSDNPDTEHLKRSGRPRAVKLKLVTRPVY